MTHHSSSTKKEKSVQLFFSWHSLCVITHGRSQQSQFIMQYQSTNTPDNLQLYLLPGWATLWYSALSCSPVLYVLSRQQRTSWNKLKSYLYYIQTYITCKLERWTIISVLTIYSNIRCKTANHERPNRVCHLQNMSTKKTSNKKDLFLFTKVKRVLN